MQTILKIWRNLILTNYIKIKILLYQSISPESKPTTSQQNARIFHKASTIEMDSRIETRSWISIALSPAYFVGEATFARHRDKYIKTGGEFVSDDDSVGSRARLSGPSPPWLLFSAFFLPRLAARSGKSTATDRPLTYICFQATRVVSGRRSWFIWSPLIDFR